MAGVDAPVSQVIRWSIHAARPSASNLKTIEEDRGRADGDSEGEGDMPTITKPTLTPTCWQRARRRAKQTKEARLVTNPLHGVESYKKSFDCMLPDLTHAPIGFLSSHDRRPADAARVCVLGAEATSALPFLIQSIVDEDDDDHSAPRAC